MARLAPKWNKEFAMVWDSAMGFYRVWVIHFGRRYGLLQEMKDASLKSPDKIADALSLSKEAVRLWLDAALSVGLIVERDGGYSIPRRLVPLLVDEEDVRFIGGLPSYLALRSLDFERFDAFFRDGIGSVGQAHSTEAFKAGTIWDHTAFLKLLVRKESGLERMLTDGAKALDVGAGAGGWSIRLAERFPSSTFVGVDPDSEAIAEGVRRAKAMGLQNVRLLVGDVASMGFSEEFDLVYLGEVLSLIRPGLPALRACNRALRKGGLVVVCEGLIVKGRTAKKEDRLAVAMQMDIALQGGRFLSRPALAGLLRESGFRRIRFYDLGGGLCFLVAQK